MTTDGKYCTLALLKQYLIGSTATGSGNTTVFNGNVQNTPDDNILSECILQAEAAFELHCGTGFDQQTLSLVQSFETFIDGNGWLHLFARERGPVTAVSAVQIRNLVSGGAWTPLTLSSDDTILPPYDTTHPNPESWHVYLKPNPAQTPAATGQIIAKWTYTGGYQTIPDSLKLLIARMSAWVYKLREVPAGQVSDHQLGQIIVPADFPPDLRRQIELWRPQYS